MAPPGPIIIGPIGPAGHMPAGQATTMTMQTECEQELVLQAGTESQPGLCTMAMQRQHEDKRCQCKSRAWAKLSLQV
jgi:hypothetical protein